MADITYLVTNEPLDSDLLKGGFINDKTPLDDHNLNTLIDGITYANANSSIKDAALKSEIETELNKKVDKVNGQGLSTNDFTTDLKNKLDGISKGADVSVQSDWSTKTETAKSFIKNKPTMLSQFTNDEGFITAKSDIVTNKIDTSDVLIINGGGAADADPESFKVV